VGTGGTVDVRDRMSQNELGMQPQRGIYAPMRDIDMELALMRKLDPAAVSKLEAKDPAAAR
jgi:hypothetical protein